VLSSVLESVQHFSRDLVAREKLLAEHAAAPGAATNGSESGVPGMPVSTGVIRNREDALRILLQVADYFRKYEPHSPICTTLEETVRRARLPFSELLAELLPDRSAWRSALSVAGIKAPEDR
jgi:type VI secretion system protein ImpA